MNRSESSGLLGRGWDMHSGIKVETNYMDSPIGYNVG